MKQWFYTLSCLFVAISFSQERTDTLTVAYTAAPPFVIEDANGLQGINVWLWKAVAEDLGQPYRLEKMDFADMLEALEAGRVDVSINPLTITSDRMDTMGFTQSFFASHSTVAVAEKTSWQKITTLFNGILNRNFIRGFLFLFVILLFFGLLIWLFERQKNPNHFRPDQRGIWDGLWWSAVTLTTVGYGDKAPKTRWGKLAALGLMLSGLLFISGLTASIASSLTVNRLTTDVKDFTEFKKLRVGTVKRSSSFGFLTTHFFKNVVSYNAVLPGLADLKAQKIDAFIYDEPILKYRIQQDSVFAQMELLPIKFDVQFYGFGIKKGNLELQQAISQRLLERIETPEWGLILAEYGLSEL